jgi:hypothetical protein
VVAGAQLDPDERARELTDALLVGAADDERAAPVLEVSLMTTTSPATSVPRASTTFSDSLSATS